MTDVRCWMRRVVPLLAILASPPLTAAEAPAPVEAPPADAPPAPDAPPSARVVEVRGDRLYLDHGRDRGLAAGQVRAVRRGDREIARVEVLTTSEHRAAVRLVESTRPPLVGDLVAVDAPPALAPAPARQPGPPPLPEAELADAWARALASQPTTPVAASPAPAGVRPHLRARADTTVAAAVDAPEFSTTRAQQSVALRAVGTDLGAPGLDLRVRAELQLRYDAVADRYLPGQAAVPLVREAALRYHPARSPWAVEAGRLRPDVRAAELIEGAQLGWQGDAVGLVGFVGLRPSLVDLAPSLHRQSLGVALDLHPRPGAARWSGQLSYGLDLADGGAVRHTLATDHHLAWGRLGAHQSLTVDALPAGATVDGGSGLDLAEASLGGRYVLRDHLDLTASARLRGRETLAVDAADLPDGWALALSGREILRADAGVNLDLGPEATLQPRLFWYEDTQAGAATSRVAGAGASWHRGGLGQGGLGLDVSADYGDGTRQQGVAQVLLSGPVGDLGLRGGAGLLNVWTFGHETGIHTFQHLAHLRLDGQVGGRFGVWANLMGGVDWSVLAGPWAPLGVLSAEAGASCRW